MPYEYDNDDYEPPDPDPAGRIHEIVRDLFKSGEPTLSYEKVCYEGSGAYKRFEDDEYILTMAQEMAENYGYTDNEEKEEFVKTGEPLPPTGKWIDVPGGICLEKKWVPNK